MQARQERTLRAALSAFVCTLVTATLHAAAGGGIPHPLVLALALVLGVALCFGLGGRRVTLAHLVLAIGATQGVLHAAFTFGGSAIGSGPGPGSGMDMGGAASGAASASVGHSHAHAAADVESLLAARIRSRAVAPTRPSRMPRTPRRWSWGSVVVPPRASRTPGSRTDTRASTEGQPCPPAPPAPPPPRAASSRAPRSASRSPCRLRSPPPRTSSSTPRPPPPPRSAS
ncbi:hypothetical protein [Clavibacter michiganensis]|uniref:hypothetical protein n=1 Tax=Clavibacter michiganensis TaxID=28447 RepID=UPI001FB37834|nr:hypothetical protein [Clavibacter michiganensis]